MKLVPNQALANPNACTICEEQPYGENVVDTERFTPFNPTYPLNGRKYVCERCAKEIAEQLGYEAGADVAIAQAGNEAARAELSNVRARVTELADHIKEFVTSNVGVDPAASAEAVQAIVDSTASPSKSAIEFASANPLGTQENPAPDTANTEPVFEDGVQVVDEDQLAADEAKADASAELDAIAEDLQAEASKEPKAKDVKAK